MQPANGVHFIDDVDAECDVVFGSRGEFCLDERGGKRGEQGSKEVGDFVKGLYMSLEEVVPIFLHQFLLFCHSYYNLVHHLTPVFEHVGESWVVHNYALPCF